MNRQTSKAIALVQNFLVYLFIDASIKDKIRAIYLFGSATRNDLTNDSDIDIFLDCSKKDETSIDKTAKSILQRFYSSKDYEKWKLLNFTYPINIQTGELASWQLKSSIETEGILLYSKTPLIESKERKVLFILNLPKEKNRYLKITRKIFGRKEKGYREYGLLKEVNGERISANAILVQREAQQKISEFLIKEKIEFKIKEIAIYK